ncbi:MAG: hypothetical protein HOO95_07415 [Gallionella sp.]|nr:hypothetical protein [Gallionella sp.]
MKRLLSTNSVVFSCFVAFLSAMLGAAVAAPTSASDFNHMSTGFPLTGAHANVVCVTCHTGGIFKGTNAACDGCHALGKRVVATPKSTSHLVTDAPCESCHFNTVTFLGARYNHSAAKPEQCSSCHNARIAQGKPSSHNSGNKATDSCDHCHRTSAYIPASWNHVGVAPGTCTTCHGVSSTGKPASHTTVAKATYQCDECHSFIGWIPAKYKHNTPGICANCHNGSVAIGKPVSHSPIAIKGINPCEDCHKTQGWLPAVYIHNAPGLCESCHDGVKAMGRSPAHIDIGTSGCSECHTSTLTWLGAIGSKPANHIPYNTGTKCNTCHIGATVVTGAALHANVSPSCKTCHNSSPVYLGRMQRKTLGNHEGSTPNQDCISCHATQYNRWNNP